MAHRYLVFYISDISTFPRILPWNGQYLWHKSISKWMLAEEYLQVLPRLTGTAVLCVELLRKFILVCEKTENKFSICTPFCNFFLHFVDDWRNKKQKNDNSVELRETFDVLCTKQKTDHISFTNNATSSSSHGVPRLLNALISHASTDATKQYL